jgi:hypothetical protein
VGYGGFNPSSIESAATAAANTTHGNSRVATSSGSGSGVVKSFRQCWQAETPGDTIKFRFFGSSVRIAVWQRRDGMGILHGTVDGDTSSVATVTGFFKGFSWAMHKNNTGRSEIVPLFDGLTDGPHILTLTVADQPANVWVKGHTVQIFALLAASDNPKCRTL